MMSTNKNNYSYPKLVHAHLGPQRRAPELSGAMPDLNGERQSARAQWGNDQSSVGTAGPQRRAPELSAPPDLNCENQISVGTAGPQLQEPDLSGHCRTSIAGARCHIECQKESEQMSDRMQDNMMAKYMSNRMSWWGSL